MYHDRVERYSLWLFRFVYSKMNYYLASLENKYTYILILQLFVFPILMFRPALISNNYDPVLGILLHDASFCKSFTVNL